MLRRIPRPLAAILAVAALHFLAWMAIVPALQVPDEPSHFAYVQRLVEAHERPAKDAPGPQYSTELRAASREAGLLPLRGNLAARETWTSLDEALWKADERRLGDRQRSDGIGTNAAAHNPPLYYLYEAVPYAVAEHASFFDRLALMRLFNLPLYLAVVALTWLLAGELLGGRLWPRALAALTVALLPQLAFIAAGVSPDIALAAVWSAFAVLAVRLVKRGVTPWSAAGVVALAAVSALTHPRGMALVPIAAAVLAIAAARRASPTRRTALLLAGGVAAAVLLVTVALTRLTGVLDTTSGAAFNAREFGSYVWQFYLPRLPSMSPMLGPPYGFRQVYVDTFYGTFGWLEIGFAPWVYDVLRIATLAGLAGLVALLIARRRALAARWPVALVVVVLIAGLVASLHYAAYRSLKVNPGDPILTGRYLFPVVALFGCAVAALAAALPRRAGPIAGACVIGAGLLLTLAGLGITAARFYA